MEDLLYALLNRRKTRLIYQKAAEPSSLTFSNIYDENFYDQIMVKKII